MTEILGLPLPLLLPLSAAAGVDLFLVLGILFLSGTAGPETPGEFLSWGFGSSILLLYLLEAWAERHPLSSLFWHTGQLVLRPLGGALLGAALLQGRATGALVLGVGVAGVVAASTHVLSWGGKLKGFLSTQRPISPLTRTLAEDALAASLTLLALERPGPAFSATAALLLGGLLAGRRAHHLVRLGMALFWDRLWAMTSPTGWSRGEDLPGWVRRWARGKESEGLRGLRAGWGTPERGAFRAGWLLEAGGDRYFAYRRPGRPEVLSLEGIRFGPGEETSICLRVRESGREEPGSALFLQKGVSWEKPSK